MEVNLEVNMASITNSRKSLNGEIQLVSGFEKPNLFIYPFFRATHNFFS